MEFFGDSPSSGQTSKAMSLPYTLNESPLTFNGPKRNPKNPILMKDSVSVGGILKNRKTNSFDAELDNGVRRKLDDSDFANSSPFRQCQHDLQQQKKLKEALSKECEELGEKYEELINRYKELQENYKDVVEESSNLKLKLKHAEQEILELSDTLKSQQEKIADLEENLSRQKTRQAANDALRQRVSEKEDAILQLQEQIKNASCLHQNEISSWTEKFGTLKKKNDEMEKKNAEIISEFQDFELKTSREKMLLTLRCTEMEARIEELGSRETQLQNNVLALNELLSAKELHHKESLEPLGARIADLENVVSTKENENIARANELDSVKAKLLAAQNDVTFWRDLWTKSERLVKEQATGHGRVIERFQERIEELTKQLADKEMIRSNQENEFIEFRRRERDLEKSLEKSLEQNEKNTEKIAALNSECGRLLSVLDERTLDVNNLATELAIVREERNGLQNETSDLRETLRVKDECIERCLDKIENYSLKFNKQALELEASQSEVRRLKDELSKQEPLRPASVANSDMSYTGSSFNLALSPTANKHFRFDNLSQSPVSVRSMTSMVSDVSRCYPSAASVESEIDLMSSSLIPLSRKSTSTSMFVPFGKNNQFEYSQNPADRQNELMERNKSLQPHLKSCYPAELSYNPDSPTKRSTATINSLVDVKRLPSGNSGRPSVSESVQPQSFPISSNLSKQLRKSFKKSLQSPSSKPDSGSSRFLHRLRSGMKQSGNKNSPGASSTSSSRLKNERQPNTFKKPSFFVIPTTPKGQKSGKPPKK